MGEITTASEAIAYTPVTAGMYTPRIVHVDIETVHKMIGAASHQAWRILAKKYKQIRLKGHFTEHKAETGRLMKLWCWEAVSAEIG